MNPNPFAGLVRSRAIWLAVIDATGAVLGLWLGAYASEQTATLIMATWAAIQPVLVVVIAKMAYEDKAKLEAASRDKETAAYAAASLASSAAVESCAEPPYAYFDEADPGAYAAFIAAEYARLKLAKTVQART